MTRKVSALLLALVTGACGSSPSAPAPAVGPAPSPAPAPVATATLTGRVLEWTPQGERPLSGALVNAWVQMSTYGYSYWFAHGRRTADAQGRYELTDLPIGALVSLGMTGTPGDYLQQCAAELTITGPSQLDVQLMPAANISASPASVPARPGFRTVMGTVYEAIPQGRRGVPNAYVAFSAVPDFDVATTRSDSDGRFLLCGLSTARALWISVYDGGRYASREVPPGADATIEIEIK